MDIVTMESLAGRSAYIAACDPIGSTEPVRYRGVTRQLPRTRVENQYLIYRLSNMRTSVKQGEYVVAHHLPPTFFVDADENITAQQAQHEILLDLSRVSNADIYGHLRDHPNQDRPIIITSTGSVVDGNRRLAAMRDLYSTDPARYASFRYVEVAVLPPGSTQDDLVELETIIQIQSDYKSDYGWIEEALGLERQLEILHWDIDKVSQLWKQSKKELIERIETLRISREYLDYIGKPGEYGEVEAAEQAIKTFRESSSTTNYAAIAPRKKHANKLVMFSVLNSTDIGHRKYDYAKNIDDITSRVLAEIDIPSTGGSEVGTNSSSPFDDLPNDSSDIDASVIEVLSDPTIFGEVANLAEEALIDIQAQKRAQKKGNQLLVAATQAHAKLVEVQKRNLRPETYSQSASKLLSVIFEAVSLLDFLVKEDPSLASRLDLAVRNQLKTAVTLSQKLNG